MSSLVPGRPQCDTLSFSPCFSLFLYVIQITSKVLINVQGRCYYVIPGQSKYTTISIVPCMWKFSNDLIFAFFAITFTLENIAKYKICRNPLFFALRNLLYYKKLLSDTSKKRRRVFPFFVNFVTCNKTPDIWYLI